MDFYAKLTAFIEAVKARAADGLTLAEIGQIAMDFIALAVALAAEFDQPGTDKKAAVMAMVGKLIDVLLPMIPLPMLIQPLRFFIDPALRKIAMAVADGVVEWIYAKMSEKLLKLPA